MNKQAKIRFDVRGYVDTKIGVKHVSHGQSGDEAVCDCPFCGKSKKLYVNVNTGLFFCYSCKERGTAPKLVAELDGVSVAQARKQIVQASIRTEARTTGDARESLNDRFLADHAQQSACARTPVALPSEFTPVWDGKKVRMPKYLLDRGISVKTAVKFRIGFCNSGRCANRIVLPVTVDDVVVTYTARTIERDVLPKYLHPDGTHDSQSVYGYDQSIFAETLYVVEGPFDALMMVQRGHKAVALLGSHVNDAKAALIRAMVPERVVVLLDGDPPGRAATPTVAGKLLESGLDVLIARMPDGTDPGSIAVDELSAALDTARPLRTKDRFVSKWL